jgi:hypothetical protein
MKYPLLCATLAVAVFLVSPAAGQTGTICLFADPGGTQCSLSDTAPGVLSVYVIHSPLSTPSGAGAVEFSAPRPDCMVGATWVADSSPLPMSALQGNSQTGVTLTYGGCISAPTHVLTVQYMVSGSSQIDCAYAVIPRPERPVVSVVTCDGDYVQGVGGVTYVNSTIACQCAEPTGPPLLRVSPSTIDFGYAGVNRQFSVINDGGGVLTWNAAESAPWMTLNPPTGSGYGEVGVVVNRTGLSVGTYETDITVSSNGGAQTVHVVMEVQQALSVTPSSLSYDVDDIEKVLRVRITAPVAIEWSISWDRPWLSAYPSGGTSGKDVRVRVDRAGLAGGTYTGTVTVTGGGEVFHVPVTMAVATGVPGAGAIGVFGNPEATACNLFDRAPGLMTFYIVHVLTAEASASEFAAPVPSCMTGAVYLGESSPFGVVIGNSQTGVSIGYGSCRSGPILLLTVRLFVQGLSEPCCLYPVVPDPNYWEPGIWMIDCDRHMLEATSAYAVVNPTGACQCSSVKTEEATWGKIKSMYSDE